MKKRGVQMSRRRKKAGEKARTMAGSAEAEKTAAGSTPAEQEAGSTSAKETLSASIEPAERSENEAEVWQTGARVRIAAGVAGVVSGEPGLSGRLCGSDAFMHGAHGRRLPAVA